MPNPADTGEDEYYDVILDDVETGIRPRKLKPADKKKKRGSSGWEYVGLAGQIGFDIALPMVLGLVVGTKLDEVWGTRPKVALVLFSLGVVFGCASLLRIVKETVGRR